MKARPTRYLIKSVTWRILATLTTFSIVYILTGKIDTAVEVGLIEVFLKMYIYYLHERIWDKIRFGVTEKKPFVVLISGLSNSGKIILANKLNDTLKKKETSIELLHGHKIRSVLPELGYSVNDRKKHLDRLLDFTKILFQNSTSVILAIEAPFKESRNKFRQAFPNFIEINMITPIEFCIENDEKGLYKKAKSGEIKNFVGVDINYEKSEQAEFEFNFKNGNIDLLVNKIHKHLKNNKML